MRLKKIAQRRRDRRQAETMRKVVIRTLNVGTMTNRGMEVVDLMKRKGMDILCVQETRWKGVKAREMRNGYKLYYIGEDGKNNGVGILLSPVLKENVLEVNRESDRVIWMRLNVDKVEINVVSAYAPQVGCCDQDKDDFWELMGEVMQKQADGANVWIGVDFNGHVGEGNAGVEVNIGKHGVERRNDGGDRIVEFAAVNNLAVTNRYFKKRLSRKITYTSDDKNSQVDYILCRRREMRNVQNCYVLPGEAVAKQHKVVVCRTVIKTNGKQTLVKVKKTKWWKLSLEEHRVKLVDKVKAILDTEGSKTWERASKAIKETAVEVLGRTSGKAGKKEETWWWNEEVQESIKTKKAKKKEQDLNRNAEAIESYKLANKAAKRAVAKAKNEVYKDLYKGLAEGEEGMHKAIRIVKQKNKESQDVYRGRQVKSSDGTVLVEEEKVKMRWSTYFGQLMNIENDRIERVIPPAAETSGRDRKN